jgi:hypothetical protein
MQMGIKSIDERKKGFFEWRQHIASEQQHWISTVGFVCHVLGLEKMF